VKALEADRDGGYTGQSAVTVEQWLDAWIVSKLGSVRAKTIAGYRGDRKRIVSSLGHLELSKLTAEDVERMYREILASGVGVSVVVHVRATLSASLKTAGRRGRIVRNPVAAAITPRYTPREIVPLSEDEALKVCAAAANGRNAPRWPLALQVGMRQGECLALGWADLDLEAGTAQVHRSLSRVTWKHGCPEAAPCGGKRGADCPARHGGGLVVGPTKTKDGKRTLLLPHRASSRCWFSTRRLRPQSGVALGRFGRRTTSCLPTSAVNRSTRAKIGGSVNRPGFHAVFLLAASPDGEPVL